LECVHKREPPSDLFTCMMLDKKTWRCLNDAFIIFIRFSSNSVMVTSVWPPTRKKAMSVSAFASFLHYKIIPTQVYKMKTKHTWQSSRMSVFEGHKSDVIYNLYVIMISSVFSHSKIEKERRFMWRSATCWCLLSAIWNGSVLHLPDCEFQDKIKMTQ
jgi:hypothetical protein